MGKNRRVLSEREKKLRSLILLVAFMGILLIVSTYAWFSTQRAVTISNISGIVNVAEGLEISLDAQNWSNAIDLSTVALNAVTTDDTLGSYSATANHVPSELKPASTIATTGGTGLTLYTGTFDGQSLKDITACDESVGTSASANYAGYYAFDIFLRDSSARSFDQQLLISAGSQVQIISTGGDETTGLQNTVRLALAEYNATTDIGAFQEEIVNTTTGSSSKISQVAIWEPNANYHVQYMVQNASRYGFKNPSRDITLTTYAINDAIATTTIENVYETTTGLISQRLTAQTTNQTTIEVPTIDSNNDGIPNLPVSYALAEKRALTDTANQAFAISANKITRLRVYVWLEGQDVDCVNYASHGGGIEIDLGIEKGDSLNITDGAAVINTTVYSTLQEAFEAVPMTNEETTVCLLQNIEETVEISSGQNIVLQLDGCKISSTSDATITNNGKLTITDGATLGGAITAELCAIYNNAGGQVIVTGGNIVGQDACGIVNAGNGTVNVIDGRVMSENVSAMHNYTDGQITISGGNIRGATQCLWNYGTGTMTISRRNINCYK